MSLLSIFCKFYLTLLLPPSAHLGSILVSHSPHRNFCCLFVITFIAHPNFILLKLGFWPRARPDTTIALQSINIGGRLIPNELMGVPQTSFLGLRNPKNVTFSIHFFVSKRRILEPVVLKVL